MNKYVLESVLDDMIYCAECQDDDDLDTTIDVLSDGVSEKRVVIHDEKESVEDDTEEEE